MIILRSPLGIIELVESLLLTGEEECGIHESKSGVLWVIAAVDISLVTIQLFKRTNGGLAARVCAVMHMVVKQGKGVVPVKSQGGLN